MVPVETMCREESVGVKTGNIFACLMRLCVVGLLHLAYALTGCSSHSIFPRTTKFIAQPIFISGIIPPQTILARQIIRYNRITSTCSTYTHFALIMRELMASAM